MHYLKYRILCTYMLSSSSLSSLTSSVSSPHDADRLYSIWSCGRFISSSSDSSLCLGVEVIRIGRRLHWTPTSTVDAYIIHVRVHLMLNTHPDFALVVKFLLGCALKLWQGMLGRRQRFQHAGVYCCHPGVLLPSHQESFQYNERQIVYALSYQ